MALMLVVGLPKCGTTTIQRALKESGINAVHQMTGALAVGEVMTDRFLSGLDPMPFRYVTQPDICTPWRNFWPQMHPALLDEIRRRHPECIFILNTRDINSHVASIQNHDDLAYRIRHAPGYQGSLKAWILRHNQMIRSRFDHVEVEIDSADAPDVLGKALGINLKWWGVENATP